MAAFASKGMSSRNSRRKWRVPVASFVLLLVILSAYMVCFVLLTLTPNTASASNEESRWEVPRTAERGSQSHNLDYNLDYVHFPPKEPQGPLDEEVVRNLSSKSFPYSPPFGFVMRDFARRVLSRHISNSNVLVIASDATAAAKDAIQSIKENKESNPYDHVDFQSPYSVGGTFLLHASAEGHGIHAIDAGVDKKGTLIESSHSLGDWWSSFGNKIIKNNNWWSSTRESKPKWIIAAVIDIDFGHEDSVWQGAETFLQESTITYFVVAMHSRKDQGGKYEYGGLAATSALLSRRYKLQTLLVSHYHADPGEESQTAERYGPNALFQSTGQTKEFLRWGADSATQYNGNNSVFTAYIFATQGLDLAIPSSRVFLHEESRIIGDESTKQINLYKPIQFKQCPQAEKDRLGIHFEELAGGTGIRVNIRIENSTDQIRHYHRRSSSALGFTYQYKTNRSHADGPNPEELTLWFNGEDIDLAEVACARLQNFSKCTTRIVENRKHATELQAENEARPNILLVLLDPMSRPHFERSMPKTKATLHRLGFTHFGNYSAVGSNSGPNQAALYSGTPVSNRDGIQRDVGDEKWLWDLLRKNGYVTLKAEDGCIENSNMLQSLAPNTTHGQALHRMFCFDFDRPNCLGPELASTHLLRYADHFVSTYEHRRRKIEPGLRWAAFLHFIDSHEDTMVLSSSVDPGLSKFLQRLDEEQKLDETLVIFLSDHGLHYGPYFQSRSGRREATEPLLYMRVPPYLQSIVNMKAFFSNARLWTTPYDVHETLVTLTGIQQQPTTVDHTRKGLSLFQQLPDNRRSCKGTAEIPALYCDLHLNGRNGDALSPGSCKKMPRPPSVLSFFADIPLHQRPQFDFDCKRMHNASVSNPSNHRQCQCATSHREWVRCSEHPWGREEIKSKNHPEEYFALMKCKGQKLAVDTRVVQQSSLLSRREEQKNPVGKDTRRKQPPNILFLEVDSVSLAYADRHLPLTRSLLKRHQMRQDPEGKTECNNGVCAADFSLFSLVGPNSVANQVTALSGCTVSRFHESCFPNNFLQQDRCSENGMFTTTEGNCQACPKGGFLRDPISKCSSDAATCCSRRFSETNETLICKDKSLFEHGQQLFRRGPRRHNTWCPILNSTVGGGRTSPWIFDIAKSKGYITLFGDEFCYEGSPFVAQDNVFPLSPDFEVHRLYCRLQECRQYKFKALGPRLCARQRTLSTSDTLNPGFDLVNSYWDAYPNVPKFAYLNAMAAHDYDDDWIKMTAVTASYDRQLAGFLSSMISRDSFENTIIIVRADHGLQGGPSTVEYAMQVEHREPWTQILIPPTLPGASLKALFQNQDKLATGFDLYHTLRDFIEPSTVGAYGYNLLQSLIPPDRTCSDAKVSPEFCLCESQVLNRPPSFGVCNPFDQYGDLYCTNKDEAILPDVLEL